MYKPLIAAVTVSLSAGLAFSMAPATSAVAVAPMSTTVTNAVGQVFKVLAHRGGANQWPENSLKAYIGSAEAGYDGIETDLAFTADGVGVMSHNDTLTDACSAPGTRIHKTKLADLQKITCNGEPIPTFTELASVLAAHPAIQLTLDVKSYSGQSSSGKRTYGTRAAKLVKQYGLTGRTRFLSYYWTSSLPAIRAVLPKAYVIAYTTHGFDYDKVRLAHKLGAKAYGAEAKNTPVNLAAFVRASHMDLITWQITNTQMQAMAIYYGPKTYWFLTDSPAKKTRSLDAGKIKLDWTKSDQVTTLATPVTIDTATYKPKKNRYPKVLGTAVPQDKLPALKTVTVTLTVTGGAAKNHAYVAAASSPSSSRVKVALPTGDGTVTVAVPVGDGGKIRIRTDKKTKLSASVVAYTNEIYS